MSCRWLCVIFLALIYAENDVERSRDHPLVSRYYNRSVIRKHSESEFETYQLRVGLSTVLSNQRVKQRTLRGVNPD